MVWYFLHFKCLNYLGELDQYSKRSVINNLYISIDCRSKKIPVNLIYVLSFPVLLNSLN